MTDPEVQDMINADGPWVDDRVARVSRAMTAAAKAHGMSLTAPLMKEWPVDILARAAIAAADQWLPIETAPRDGGRRSPARQALR